MKKIIIAIDGYSSCGKSTMARTLAKKAGYIYIDTGAMYRAVTLFCLENNLVSPNGIDTSELEKRMPEIKITFTINPETGGVITHLNGKNVESEIRTLEVSQNVSRVAALPFVRECLTTQQREMGKQKGIVMDGRDIGTVVLPDADLKVFLTASAEERANRRFKEMIDSSITYEQVLEDIKQRDYNDMHRDIAPLKQAEDAVLLDTTGMTIEEVKQKLKVLIDETEKSIG